METKKRMHYGFVIVIAIFIQYILAAGIFFGASGMFIVPVTTSLGIGQGEFAMYLTIQNVAMASCTLIAPKLMAKFKFKSLNAIGVILSAVGFGMMGFAQNTIPIYVGGALIGVSLTFLTFLSPGTLLPRWFQQKLGTMLAIVGSASSIGGMLFNPVISALINSEPMFGFSESWRSAYVLLAVLVLVICLPVALFMLKDSPKDMGMRPYGEVEISSDEAATTSLNGVTKATAVKSGAFACLVLMIISWNLASGIFSYFPAYAGTAGGATFVTGIIGSVTMVGGVIGGFVIGNLNDKKGGQVGGLFAGVCGVIGLANLMVGGNSAIALLGGAAVFGLYYAIANVQLPAMVTTLFGNRDYDKIFQTAAAFCPWFGAISYSLWGFIYDGTGSYTLMLIAGIILCAVTAGSGIAAVSFSKKLKEKSAV